MPSIGMPPDEAARNESAAAGRPHSDHIYPAEYLYRGAMLVAALLLLWSANA